MRFAGSNEKVVEFQLTHKCCFIVVDFELFNITYHLLAFQTLEMTGTSKFTTAFLFKSIRGLNYYHLIIFFEVKHLFEFKCSKYFKR